MIFGSSVIENLGQKPPIFGFIEFNIAKPPVSLQTNNKNRKTEFKEFVKNFVKKSGFLLSGDIKIQIEWYVYEQKRYETDKSADVDNIIKPLLDALCGSSGVMIDDNQVQSVTCSWVDSYEQGSEQLKVTIRFSPDEFVLKEGLVFIHMGNQICMPINENTPTSFQIDLLKSLQMTILERNNFLDKGIDYYQAKLFMSVQRVFHKSRLSDFDIKELENKLAELEQS